VGKRISEGANQTGLPSGVIVGAYPFAISHIVSALKSVRNPTPEISE
jgi:hypothetical protein